MVWEAARCGFKCGLSYQTLKHTHTATQPKLTVSFFLSFFFSYYLMPRPSLSYIKYCSKLFVVWITDNERQMFEQMAIISFSGSSTGAVFF